MNEPKKFPATLRRP